MIFLPPSVLSTFLYVSVTSFEIILLKFQERGLIQDKAAGFLHLLLEIFFFAGEGKSTSVAGRHFFSFPLLFHGFQL